MLRRRLAQALIGLALAASSAACSGDDRPVDQAWLEPALLAVDDLGPAFEVAPDDAEDTDGAGPDFGCLFDLGPFGAGDDSGDDGPEIEFRATEEPQMPSVVESLTDTGDGERAAHVFDKVIELTEDCARVDTTDGDGMRWQFDVANDDETWAPGADQQLTISATGTATAKGIELPISFAVTMVRRDDVVLMAMFFDMSKDVSTAHRQVVTAACERLNALIEGDPLPDRRPVLADYPVGATLRELLGGQAPDPAQAA
ncbi:hypothetical protein [Nocardioides daejeonensis]|uniref:hypothetical protein n=1 Tax=Nocardioides daejeonensis TaxID=1046556 RepID=UPI000D742DD0|nr:hypothetical protein [Nocardioides daejeonensis]